jgi:hypothetical protein
MKITIRDYNFIAPLLIEQEGEDELTTLQKYKRICSIIYKVDEKDIDNWTIKKLKRKVKKALNIKFYVKLTTPYFVHNWKIYKVIKRLDNISMNRGIDLLNLAQDTNDLNRMPQFIAVVTKQVFPRRKYDADYFNESSKSFQNLDINKALPIYVFFCNLLKTHKSHLSHYFQELTQMIAKRNPEQKK